LNPPLEYVIRNAGNGDLVRQASFPLPVFDRAPLEAERSLDGADAGNPLALTVRVNGKPQPVHTDRLVVGHADGMMSPVRVTRTWTQPFPAGQAVTIGLDYRAAADFNGIYPLSASDARAVCLSEATRKIVNERISGGPPSSSMSWSKPWPVRYQWGQSVTLRLRWTKPRRSTCCRCASQVI
jgi:hypothetical protein